MALTEPILDLIIMDTHNSKTLAVGDGSTYPTNFNTVSPTLQVKVPGYPEVSMPFVPKNIQLYNSLSLGLNCDDDCPIELPDGLYKFVYTLTPAYKYKTEKYFLKVDRLYAKFDEAYLKLDIHQKDGRVKQEDFKILEEVEQYIQGAISAANQCAQKLAIDLYNKAAKKLDAFLANRCYG